MFRVFGDGVHLGLPRPSLGMCLMRRRVQFPVPKCMPYWKAREIHHQFSQSYARVPDNPAYNVSHPIVHLGFVIKFSRSSTGWLAGT